MSQDTPRNSSQEKQKIIPQNPPRIGQEGFSHVEKMAAGSLKKVTGNQDNPEWLVRWLSLLDRQKLEQQGILERYGAEKTQALSQSSEKRWELLTDQARKILYDTLGIQSKLENNSGTKKFAKWVVDGAIIGNMEFIEMIVKEPMKAIEAFKSLLSIEGLKGALKAIGKSLYDLIGGDPYDTGKSIGELGLVAAGAGLAVGLAKKGLKTAVKQEAKGVVKEGIQAGGQIARETVLKNAALSNTERILKAEEILGRKLSKEESQAIIKAHEAGSSSIYQYTKPELKQKARILKDEAKLSPAERRRVMEEGIAGRSSTATAERAVQRENTIIPKIGDIMLFDNRLMRPIDCLNTLRSLNKHLNIDELIGNYRWLREFTQSIEKFSTYITDNVDRFGPRLAEDAFHEAKDLRNHIRKIVNASWLDVIDTVPLMTAVENDFARALNILQQRYIR